MNQKRPWLLPVLESIIFLVLAATLLQRIIDPDIWFHLAIGREIFSLGSIPANEFLVYPNLDKPGEFHEWAYGLLFYLVYEAGGYWGISVLNALFGSLVFWWLFRATGPRPLANPLNLVVLLAVVYWMEFRLVYRVEIVLYLALACEIFLLERFLSNRSWRWLVPIPVIGLLLSQAHPSVVFLVAVLGIYGLQLLWECRKDRAELTRLFIWLALCGMATLLFAVLNPYGIKQVLLPFTFVGEQRVTRIVMEFMPALESPLRWSFLLMLTVSVAAVAVNRKRRISDVLLLLVFGFLAFQYVRNIGLFALVMYVPIAHGLTDFACNVKARLGRGGSGVRLTQLQWVSWVIAVVIFVWAAALRFNHPRWGAGPAPGLFPESTARMILEIQPPGRIFNHYELGGYLAWTLQGAYKVFIDGRHYGMNKAFSIHSAVMHGRPGWKRALERYGVNVIITQGTWSHEAQLVPLVRILAEDTEWGLIGRGERALLFLRKAGVPDIDTQHYLEKSEIWEQVRLEAEANISMFPNQAMAYQALGEAMYGLGDRGKAIEAYQHYLRLAPDDQDAAGRLRQIEAGGQ